MPFPRILIQKGNMIVWLKFKLTHFKATVQHFNHYAMRTLFNIGAFMCQCNLWAHPYFPICAQHVLSWWDKMRILWSGRHVNIIVWLHDLVFDKTPEKKAWWKLHKDGACCFEQTLEVASTKTATVQLFTSHLTNHPNKMNTYTHARTHTVCSKL